MQSSGIGQHTPIDQIFLDRVNNQVSRSHAGVDVETGDPQGVVVIEHQPVTLLVGIKKRL